MKEHETYRLQKGTGDPQAAWTGMTWHRYARWYHREDRTQKFEEVMKGPFPSPARAQQIFVEEVERRLADGYRWASKERFGAGARADAPAPAPARSKPWPTGKAKRPAWWAKVPAVERTRVRTLLERAKLEHRADDILALARPAIRFALTTARAPARVTTRFGGAPDLPPGLAWPMNGATPLAFVAQIRLDEVARLDLEGRLPRAGLLSVFAHLALDGSDDYGERGRLLHVPDTRRLVRTTPPGSAKQDGRPSRTASATARLALTLPALGEPAFRSLRLTDDEAERYDEAVLPAVRQARTTPSKPGAHQLLGWPDTPTPSRSEELLGQIDSDGRFGFEVGDVETLRLWISSRKLAAGELARVRFTLQAD